MSIEKFDQLPISNDNNGIDGIRNSLNQSFDSGFSGDSGALRETNDFDVSIANWLGTDNPEVTIDGISENRASIFDIISDMFSGHEIDESGRRSLSLEDVSNYNINPEYRTSNIRQQSGFAAEIISTARENIQAIIDGTGTRSYRVDDLSDAVRQELRDLGDTYDYALRNDQYVDRIRIFSDGTVERIQTKFVGSNAEACFQRLRSSSFDKYFTDKVDGRPIVDRLEIPRDYYDEIIHDLLPSARERIARQLERAMQNNDTELVRRLQIRLDRLNDIERIIEASSVTSREARFARLHPRIYSTALFAGRSLGVGLREGLEGAAFTAVVTAGVSTIDNYRAFMNGDVTIEEALADIARDTGLAAVEGFIPDFITGTVNAAFEHSSHTLLRSMSHLHVPAMVVSFAIDSYDEISDFAAGEITGMELSIGLGDNLMEVIGATAGAAACSFAGPVGSLAGSVAGAALASKAYETVVELADEYGADAVEAVVDVAEEFRNNASLIYNEVNNMAADVHDSLTQIADDFNELTVDTQELAQDTSQLADVIREANEQLRGYADDVQEQLQEGSQAVIQTVDNARDAVADAANEAANQIQEGAEVVEEYVAQLVTAAETYGQRALECGNQAIQYVRENIPDEVDSIVSALNSFATDNDLPFIWG